MPESGNGPAPAFYCPQCDRAVETPLRCGDCGSLLCPRCGTPVEQADELGMG